MSYNGNQFTQINYSGHYITSHMPMTTPLTITPVTMSNEDNACWSPFSAPSFSPYESNYSRFQYSSRSCFSPSQNMQNYKNLPPPIGSKSSNNKAEIMNYSTYEGHYQNHQKSQQFDHSQLRSKRLPKRSDNIDMTDLIRTASIQKANGGRVKLCTFCRTNGEVEQIYMSHSLKDSSDRITCPILQRYVCPDCGATGEKTHTKKYCPVLQKKLRMEMLRNLQNQ